MSSADEGSFHKPYDQFLLFGDSITQLSSSQELGFGLQPALQHDYSRVLDVINRGFGGYNTANAVKAFPKFFPAPETASVRFMTIWFGANDASIESTTGQHVPLDVYKKNLAWLVQYPATVAQQPRILIITPAPVNEHQMEAFDVEKGYDHPTRKNSLTRQYAEAAREVGDSLKVPVIDLWTAFMTAAGWKEGQPLIGSSETPNNEKLASLLTDGLHFTPDGYRIVYDEIVKAIATNWPDQVPEKLPQIFPPWNEAPK
ncbi:SGNH hydrolase-type esterase domain-containing protein [Aspergillus varians]